MDRNNVFDYVVIGSGGASYLADEAINSKDRLAMIEATGWGGTCLNRGCIPTKVMVHAADLIRMSQRAKDVAVSGEALQIDWPHLKKRVFDKIHEGDSIVDYYAQYENVSLFKAWAKFAGKTEIEGEEYFEVSLSSDEDVPQTIYAKKAIIANGGRTNVPGGIGLEDVDYLSSEALFDEERWPDTLPESMIIIGGGDIGVEFAHIFSSFGVKIDLVQRGSRLVPKQDAEISDRLYKILQRDGIQIHLNALTQKSYLQDGKKALELEDKITGEGQTLLAEEIFVCPGIRSNTDTLSLETIGLQTNERGWIDTNEYLETSVPHVYAMGDVNGKYMLRHKSNYEGKILAHNLMGKGKDNQELWKKVDYSLVPAGTFTSMQISSVGLTEEQAKKEELEYKVAYTLFSDTAQGYAHGYEVGAPVDGMAKVLIDKNTNEFIGVHVISPEATAIVQSYVYLMAAGKNDMYRPDQFQAVTEAMTIHPSISEIVLWGLEGLENE